MTDPFTNTHDAEPGEPPNFETTQEMKPYGLHVSTRFKTCLVPVNLVQQQPT